MKKFINKIRNKFSRTAISAKTALANVRGEGYVDTGVKILIAVVIGALLLTLLYTLFADEVFPTLSQKIQALFNYSGSGN